MAYMSDYMQAYNSGWYDGVKDYKEKLATALTTGSALDADEFCKAYAEEWQDTLKEQSDRIKELEADVAENDALIDSLREQITAPASPEASVLTDAQRWKWLQMDSRPGEQTAIMGLPWAQWDAYADSCIAERSALLAASMGGEKNG